MLFNNQECVIVDDALITPEGVIDLEVDVFLMVAALLVALHDEDDPAVPALTGNSESRAQRLASLNSNDLWAKDWTHAEAGKWGHRGHRYGTKCKAHLRALHLVT